MSEHRRFAMHIEGQARLARIFIGESDTLHGRALSGVIVEKARANGLAGATMWRGSAGFGATSHLRSSNILDLSSDLPIIVEIVDKPERLDDFMPMLDEMLESAGCGGLVTIEDVEIRRYFHGKQDRPQ